MMLDYKTLGFIAGSINPLLGAIALGTAFSYARRRDLAHRWAHVVALLTGVGFAYVGWAFKVSALWPTFSQNYSTHTAVCVALVSYLVFASKGLVRLSWPAIAIAYAALMLYQQYHTLVHVLATLAVVGPPVFLLHKRTLHRSQ